MNTQDQQGLIKQLHFEESSLDKVLSGLVADR